MDGEPQFGVRREGLTYRIRETAFGVAAWEGRIALARIRRDGHSPCFDLPGGALDPGESHQQALVREFGEETGLRVAPVSELCRAGQYLIRSDGEPVNNRARFWRVRIEAEVAALKIEADHELAWMSPAEAVARLRHDSHAWAVACWLRAT